MSIAIKRPVSGAEQAYVDALVETLAGRFGTIIKLEGTAKRGMLNLIEKYSGSEKAGHVEKECDLYYFLDRSEANMSGVLAFVVEANKDPRHEYLKIEMYDAKQLSLDRLVREGELDLG